MGCAINPQLALCKDGILTLLLTTTAIGIVLYTYRKRHAMGSYFMAFALMGVASLFVPQMLYLIPVLLLCCQFMQSLYLRSALAALLGVLLPYWTAFCVLFLIALFVVLRIIPGSINAAAKAKELETERNALNAQLAQSRIATMMSQIRPHFIYNALGTIEYLCEEEPQKAKKLVHSFAKYLRGNFGEMDNPRPIHMSQEMEHVRHYISIENVRFPDMTFTFDMNSDDFMLPALTIQPIVENAIKHGLMPLDRGGSVRVTSWETPSHYCVSIEDDGVGFDTGILLDERKHIGLRNIRERLETMVDGSLLVESTIGNGTKVQINIPKERTR